MNVIWFLSRTRWQKTENIKHREEREKGKHQAVQLTIIHEKSDRGWDNDSGRGVVDDTSWQTDEVAHLGLSDMHVEQGSGSINMVNAVTDEACNSFPGVLSTFDCLYLVDYNRNVPLPIEFAFCHGAATGRWSFAWIASLACFGCFLSFA